MPDIPELLAHLRRIARLYEAASLDGTEGASWFEKSAKTVEALSSERDALKSEVERLRTVLAFAAERDEFKSEVEPTSDGEIIDGEYGKWKWCPLRKCWELLIPARIYPLPDGTFVTSYAEVWNTGKNLLRTFKEAELHALKGDIHD